MLVFLELIYIFETFSLLRSSGHADKFCDFPVYFMFIIHHIIGSFVGNVLINVVLGSFISLFECGLSLLTQGNMVIGRSLELGFPKCVFVQYLIL